MKKLLTAIAISLSTIVFSQIPGVKIEGPLQVNENLSVKEGDTLKIGTGTSGAFGDFRFIYTPANGWLGTKEESLPRSYAGKSAVIKMFKKWEQKKSGTKVFTVVNLGGLNEVVELESAIAAGEIVAINGKPFGPKTEKATSPSAAPTSAADEIRKLKALYDEGILTKEEYEAKKKKLLEQ